MTERQAGLPQDRETWPVVGILLPNWNGHQDTLGCLESLGKLDYPKGRLEIVVVDNGSHDGSSAILGEALALMRQEGWRRAELTALPGNIGIPCAYSTGYGALDEKVEAVLRVESDVLMDPECLKYLTGTMLPRDDIGSVGATICNYWSHARERGAINFRRWTGRFIVTYPDQATRCQGVLGCTMLVRRRAVEALRYFFDETLKISTDETDLSFRLARIGYATWYEPRAVTYHKSGGSTKKARVSRATTA